MWLVSRWADDSKVGEVDVDDDGRHEIGTCR